MQTSDEQLVELIRRLRNGPLTNEHTPFAIAYILEAMLVERRAMTNQVLSLESFITPRTGGAYRNMYASGWYACQEAILRQLPLSDVETEIRAIKPDFSNAAKVAGAMVQ